MDGSDEGYRDVLAPVFGGVVPSRRLRGSMLLRSRERQRSAASCGQSGGMGGVKPRTRMRIIVRMRGRSGSVAGVAVRLGDFLQHLGRRAAAGVHRDVGERNDAAD